jgi:hypothetical protein
MTAKTFLAKLNTLAATPGKKDKLEIVKSFDEIDLALAKARWTRRSITTSPNLTPWCPLKSDFSSTMPNGG